ncbi:MAG: RNA-guided pseudouridylation complex pseudouridine synthase subunit Cbf5 [Candidatus Lokiarchaeota archaeon]|nr:RNA-guided pseudouridylation complex pseudouridine synthase subunit Cbf5 [Candidatus Lokiarchaeota archaeon]
MARKLPVERSHDFQIKAEEETSPDHGCSPDKRSLIQRLDHGLINLDKVAGPTSHEVASWVKRVFSASSVVTKTGHGGTLDPKVTGVLPIALNKAARVVDVLLTAGKEYVCIMKLHGDVEEARIRSVLSCFEGRIYQRPPVRAAVKRVIRVREIYSLKILEIDGQHVLFKVGCEAGTYIRKLCYDIGEVLGCGAHMEELRRTRSGPFVEDDTLVTLQDLVDSIFNWQSENDERELSRIVYPMEAAFSHLPHVIIRDSAVDPVCHGANLTAPGILKLDRDIDPGDTVAVFTQKGEVVAIGKSTASTSEVIAANSGFMVETTRVFMDPGTYPKWVKK